MKNIVSLTVIFAVVFLALTSVATADVPTLMQYQGFLTDDSGEPLDTMVDMTFTIYDAPTGPGVIWTETQDTVTVSSGLFHVLLGSVNSIVDTVFAETERWLGITVAPDPEIVPRTRLVTVPWAYRVATVDGAFGGGIFGDVHLHSTLTVGSLEEADPGRIEVTDGVNPVIIADGVNKQVGIGLVDPNGQLHVETSDYLYSASFTSFYPAGEANAVRAEHLGAGTYDAKAVYGRSIQGDYYGLGGLFEGGWVGVGGLVSPTGSNSYYGVRGEVFGGSGWNYGVYGLVEGVGGNVGVEGDASGDSMNYGVRGYATDASGLANYGVYGSASGSEVRYGVYGNAGGPAIDYAGYFRGNVNVTGTLGKGGGGFKIDHPLDPENRYLYHSFVESPDMKNVYDGVAVLEANGQATVELPDYFDAVNKDFRYQLTCIGGFAPVYIAEEISGNQFTIAGGEAGTKISWQVTGIRKDAFAEANRIQVEVDKPERERGKYLHPEAHGVGEQFGIHYEEHKRMEEKPRTKSIRKMQQR
jgi:hypothetical protein